MESLLKTSLLLYVPKKLVRAQTKMTSQRIIIVQQNSLTFIGPACFVYHRDRDRSRLKSAMRYQHATLMDWEVLWEFERGPLDLWEDNSPNFTLKVKQ